MNPKLRRVLRDTLRIIGIQKYDKNILEYGSHIKEFQILLREIEPCTTLGPDRCFILYQLAKQTNAINGDAAEIGVYKGGTARLIARTAPKTVHIFDTFSGMPPTDKANDLHLEGDFSGTSFQSVKEYLKDCSNIRMYPGFFPETAAPIKELQFCFVHIDVDIYKSVRDCCEFFYPRMVQGGIMVFDDYGFLTCPGAKMAVDEFFAVTPEYPCNLPTGQCIVIKL